MEKPLHHEERFGNSEKENINNEASSIGCTPKRPSRRLSSEARVYDPISIFYYKVKFQNHSKSCEKSLYSLNN